MLFSQTEQYQGFNLERRKQKVSPLRPTPPLKEFIDADAKGQDAEQKPVEDNLFST
jgi:hypothetical protein